jgi:hypothetical protein
MCRSCAQDDVRYRRSNEAWLQQSDFKGQRDNIIANSMSKSCTTATAIKDSRLFNFEVELRIAPERH